MNASSSNLKKVHLYIISLAVLIVIIQSQANELPPNNVNAQQAILANDTNPSNVIWNGTYMPFTNISFNQWIKNYSEVLNLVNQNTLTFRKLIYEQNRRSINSFNLLSGKKFKKGINQFTGLTFGEYQELVLNPIQSQTPRIEQRRPAAMLMGPGRLLVPGSTGNIDWSLQGKVSPPRDQGYCSSCYAFSTVAAIESFHLQQNNLPKNTFSFSVQQVLSCSSNSIYGNENCRGGWHTKALLYALKNPLATETSYPYQASNNINKTCQNTIGTYEIPDVWLANGYNQIMTNLVYRPIVVAINANLLKQYDNGIIQFSDCINDQVNHGVLLVGRYQTTTDKYLLLKNSYGAQWGEKGFFRIEDSDKKGCTCSICWYEAAFVDY